ncbi:(RS)-norcoclaurine 6-O-methyltransferase [Morus notabilis]|uniref:(RS)-norcoclaurine 6-O-methyltransferase n=1 Tax=Morus notabilis TaxID=981085 RepID=W9QRI7_9ROSA|nr:(RS)-norcoclaurine 6-O-methyltransferase [Morus notabilis]
MDSADDENLRGQAEIWKYMFRFVDSMALRCVVELRIPDIINSHGGPITLAQIVSSIPEASSPDISCLARIMRFLVRRNIFTAHHPSNGSEDITLYGLTHLSRWLLTCEQTLAPMLLWQTDPTLMTPMHYFSGCVKGGGVPFEKAHGRGMFAFMSENEEFGKACNDAMECTARIILKEILSDSQCGDHVFGCLGSLIDVGGGTGGALSEIVKSYPHIKGINFDLPHVVSKAPVYAGVSHVAGDMFESIPSADAWIMHDWMDEDCVKILKNCRKAVPEKSGKVIIVDVVLDLKGNGLFDDMGLILDLLMAAHSLGGKERTEKEWKKILKEGGFSCYKIIRISTFLSIIEAYPE